MAARRTLMLWLVSAVLALVGLVDSIYLVAVKLNPAETCGAGSSCDLANQSVMSEIFGVPIAVLGAGFFVAWLVVLAIQIRGVRGDDPAGPSKAAVGRSVHLLMATAANLYSLALLIFSFVELGSPCPYCAVLYGVNLALLVVTILARIEPKPRPIAAGGVLAITAVAFLASAGVGFAAYRSALPDPSAKPPDPLADPNAKKHAFDAALRASVGPEDAPIHFVEFADFECPHCREFYHTLEAIAEARPDKVRISYLAFPLDDACNRSVPGKFHERACELAVFAECANRQGKYGDVAAMLYESGSKTAKADLVEQFVGVGLDRAKLDQCLADPSALAVVKADIEQALKAGVDGTPALFMNGVQVRIRPLDYYLELIDAHANDGK